MQPFDYFKPKDFDEAFQLLNTPGKTVYPYAGGTDFIPMTRDGVWKCDAVVDIKGLPGESELRFRPERTMQELVEISAFYIGLPVWIKPE